MKMFEQGIADETPKLQATLNMALRPMAITRPTALPERTTLGSTLESTGRTKTETIINITITGNQIASNYDIDRIGEKLVRQLRLAGVAL
jgi:hypothetical protein